jgi:hypothetical protein
VPNSGRCASKTRETVEPTPGTLREPVVALPPHGTGTQHLVQLAIHIRQCLLQPGNVGGDLRVDGGQGLLEAVLFRGEHVHQLATPLHECAPRRAVGSGQRMGGWLQRLRTMREHRRIDGIGLSQPSGRLGARRAPGAD